MYVLTEHVRRTSLPPSSPPLGYFAFQWQSAGGWDLGGRSAAAIGAGAVRRGGEAYARAQNIPLSAAQRRTPTATFRREHVYCCRPRRRGARTHVIILFLFVSRSPRVRATVTICVCPKNLSFTPCTCFRLLQKIVSVIGNILYKRSFFIFTICVYYMHTY